MQEGTLNKEDETLINKTYAVVIMLRYWQQALPDLFLIQRLLKFSSNIINSVVFLLFYLLPILSFLTAGKPDLHIYS